MECSTVKKLFLPENIDGRQKIICKINSTHTQYGDNNKAYVDTDASRRVADSIPNNETIDLGKIIEPNDSENSKQFEVNADIVQVIPRDDSWLEYTQLEIQSKRKDSTVQAGNNTVLRLLQDKSNAEGVTQSKRLQRKKKRPNPKRLAKTKANDNIVCQPSDKSRSLYKKFFEEVSSVLHPLRDDGKWDMFNDNLNELRSKYGNDPSWDILLTLEQAQQMCYHSSESNIVEADQILCATLRKIPERLAGDDPSIRQLCEGRAYCYLASVKRHQRGSFLGKANGCLAEAQNRLKATGFLYDEATVYYEKASILLEFDKQGSNAEEIRLCLDKCSQLCDEINKERKWEFVKKGHFAKLKKAMLLLNCTTNIGRKRRISDEDLKEAKQCLEELESENYTRKEVPISEQLQCLLAKSDKAFRCSRYNEAKETIENAIALANKHGFDENPARKRLQDIESMLQKNVSSSQKGKIVNEEDSVSESSGGDADISATAEDTD